VNNKLKLVDSGNILYEFRIIRQASVYASCSSNLNYHRELYEWDQLSA